MGRGGFLASFLFFFSFWTYNAPLDTYQPGDTRNIQSRANGQNKGKSLQDGALSPFSPRNQGLCSFGKHEGLEGLCARKWESAGLGLRPVLRDNVQMYRQKSQSPPAVKHLPEGITYKTFYITILKLGSPQTTRRWRLAGHTTCRGRLNHSPRLSLGTLRSFSSGSCFCTVHKMSLLSFFSFVFLFSPCCSVITILIQGSLIYTLPFFLLRRDGRRLWRNLKTKLSSKGSGHRGSVGWSVTQ